MNLLKKLSKNILFKQKLNTFLSNNRDISKPLDRVYGFLKKYWICYHKNLEDYQENQDDWKSIYLVTLTNLLTLLTCLRYLFSSLIREQWVAVLMSDANHWLGNQKFISLMISIAAFVIFSIEAVIERKELTKTNELIQFMYDFKHKRIIPLNDKHNKRLVLIVNLLAKYVMEQAFWPLVILSQLPIMSTTIIEYFDQESGYNLIGVIFWNIVLLVFLIKFYAVVWFGFVVSVLSTLYLKYKFEEINEEIKSCIKFNLKYRLKRAITQHNYICVKTSQLNNYFDIMCFQLYYIASPALLICLYLTHAKDTNPYGRYISAFIFVLVFFVVFSVNLLYAQISRSSRRPRNIVYRHMIRKQLSVEESLELLAFIEKLDGPDIGFYCWNLHPMNNYEFYLYVANCASTYFLILGLA